MGLHIKFNADINNLIILSFKINSLCILDIFASQSKTVLHTQSIVNFTCGLQVRHAYLMVT